ncbi:DUF72 domain-containing protein [uncultured Massilia sp.]|uniref:DUF72 domain-containing protein n=1 Tax=uncultured Massilia sp. TaxID=169973 RepID=UPI0026015098|nr:DUF72 domain-containing protein [uncultured Massilia sp.]
MSKLQSTRPGRRLIGCAGWGLNKEVAAAFPAEGSHLERYAAVFPAVEINSSFYRPHQPATYARWAASVPDDFRFSVKLPKAITHEARLRDADDLLDRFAREAGGLGAKLGCVLVQLPPSGAFDEDVVRAFLPRLRARFACLLALEGRHPTWFGAAATALLREHGVARVIADPPAGQPGEHVPTANAAYIRLHGTPRVYYSPYPPEALARIALQVEAARAGGADAWCIFDNTAEGHSVPNALAVLQGGTAA